MQWIVSNWNLLLPQPWSSVTLALISVGCGLIVGAEREKNEKPAGLRTMTLVCLGATVFTMISFAVAGTQGDRGRIAAQIVSGVGFLGAGAILRGRAGVRGLTTAATIWAVAAMGMVVGAGYPAAGFALGICILLVLTVAKMVERRYLGPCEFAHTQVVFDPSGGKTTVKVNEIVDDAVTDGMSREEETLEDGSVCLRFSHCRTHKQHKEFLTRLAELPETREIRSNSN